MIPAELLEAVRTRRIVLFVGAGVSMNLDLPSWSGLIDQMATQLGYDPDVFSMLGGGNFYVLAEFYRLRSGKELKPLIRWMLTEWAKASVSVKDSAVHKLIVQLDFPIIYTTNYDNLLEEAFRYYKKPFTKIASVADITRMRDGIPQIVKFHGDFDEESIVLTETSYFERLDFESPLDIKLRADVLGRPVLFIGYSVTDINIRYLLYKLNRLWEASHHDRSERPKSYVLVSAPNPVRDAVLKERGVVTIDMDSDAPKIGMESFLRRMVKHTRSAKK